MEINDIGIRGDNQAIYETAQAFANSAKSVYMALDAHQDAIEDIIIAKLTGDTEKGPFPGESSIRRCQTF